MKMKLRLVGGMMLASVTLMLGSCVSDSDSAGLEYMPDMYRSAAIEPYVDYGEVKGRENVELKMTQSALTPPNGTIPYYGTNEEAVSVMLPWSILPNIAFKQTHGLKGVEFTTEDTYNTSAAALTENPLEMEFMTEKNEEGEYSATNLTLKRGKKLYEANCMHCHGAEGDGKGPMMKNGTFNGVPNYADKKALSDGQLFYSIYYGKGAMGSHASIVNKKEIWSLVHYIRKIQYSDYDNASKEAAIAKASGLPVVKEQSDVEVMGGEGDEVHHEELSTESIKH